MEITYKKLKFAAVLYAAIPVAIFFIGWLNALSAIAFTLMLAAGVYFFYKRSSDDDGEFKSITVSKKTVIALAFIALIWCVWAGQGRFMHQTDDHTIRNAIHYDLITKSWPVTYKDGTKMLSYYIAHWMVPAFFGKIVYLISGSAFAGYLTGNIFLLLWSSVGCFIVFLLIGTVTNTGNKQRIFIAVFIFIFFSGLDVIGELINNHAGEIYGRRHMEWWANYFQFSSNSTCLFWVFNQAIVPWILTLCLINEKKIHNLAALGILAFPYGPFPFVGMVLMCILKAIRISVPEIKKKNLKALLLDIFSPQNVLLMLSVAPIFILYYTSNAIVASNSAASAAASAASSGSASAAPSFLSRFFSGKGNGLRLFSAVPKAIASHDTAYLKSFFSTYAKFIILEVGVYLVFIFKRKKPDLVFGGMCVSLLFIPLIQMGAGSDFSMRVSIPALVYICVMFTRVIMEEIPDWGKYSCFYDFARHKKFLIAAIIVYMIGASCSTMEFRRELVATVEKPYSEIVNFRSGKSLESYGLPSNFTASNYKNSAFYKYFCKKK